MLGLVIAGAERIGLKLKPAAAVLDFPPKPATFEEELAARGITTVPMAAVREYQQRYMREQQKARLAGN